MAQRKILVLACLLALCAAAGARAQSSGSVEATRPGREPLPRDGWLFDLIPRVSDDPDLLSAHEALVRQRLLDFGVDPRGERESVSTATLLRRHLADSADEVLFEESRQVEILEVAPDLEHVVLYRFPEPFLFYTDPDTNEVGMAFEPPRPVEDPQVKPRIITREGYLRTWGTIALDDAWRTSLLQHQAAARAEEGLLNFTLPIKLPRTLERLIGKGEATSIRISGQERISISGTSTVYDNFLGNEVQQKQSLFPTLEMEQSLRVNLDGQVGEKIKVRVSHDSDAFGSQATQVKLSFEGDEDDIIRTIRAGDIDVTLPGSRLLGITAQRGGLFGLKVEGALGPLDFTMLTSKEQSEQGKRSFNAAGGTTQEFTVRSVDYVKNRIFRLNAPFPLFFRGGDDYVAAPGDTIQIPRDLADQSAGWPSDWSINLSTLDVYVNAAAQFISDRSQVLDSFKGRAYVETTGYYWGWNGGTPDPNAVPDFGDAAFKESDTWRRLSQDEWSPITDADSRALIGILLSAELSDQVAMGVTYDVVDGTGAVVMRVGRPWFNEGVEPILDPENAADESERIYYFKLIAPGSTPAPDPTDPEFGQQSRFDLTWEYMLRNYYFLRGVGIDPSTLEVEIRLNNNDPQNDYEEGDPETRRRWLNVFGLDTKDPQGNPVEGGDGLIDLVDANVVDPSRGLLQFPIATPFDAPYLTGSSSQGGNGGTRAPGIYRRSLTSTGESQNHYFNLIIRHASTSSRLSLGAFNIKEGSEEVRLDGRQLVRGTDYDIDYFSGEITLTGAASLLNAQSNLSVDFEVDPLFGGGRTSLSGLNLGYRLGRNKTLSSTWLLQTKPTSNRKPRLGEEPTRDWVGNLSAKLQFEPQLISDLANILPMVQSTEPSRLNLDAEVAVSIPNPNTSNDAYIDDFEAVDRSDIIPMSREGWWWASLPAEFEDDASFERRFQPEDRAYIRYFRPKPAVNREDLNPSLSEQERRDVVPALQLRMEAQPGAAAWGDSLYTGIMRGYAGDLDLTEAQFLEFWVNDFTPEPNAREGVLHFDFGDINEDFYWKSEFAGGELVYEQGEYDQEDQDVDGVLQTQEDIGLDGVASGFETGPLPPYQNLPTFANDLGADDYDATEGDLDNPFLRINGLERNQKLDTEDINRNGFFNKEDGYFTLTVDLRDTERVLVDVNESYPDFVPNNDRKLNNSWRKYRIDIKEAVSRAARNSEQYFTRGQPDLSRIKYFRIWYELPGGSTRTVHNLQFAEMRFLGNRWLADGIHDSETHDRIPELEALPASFSLGVINNKENPDYRPPLAPDVRNNVAEKEQSLQLAYTDLGPGQEIRVRKDVPGSTGQDFSQYSEIKYYWLAPLQSTEPPVVDPDQLGLIPYLWVGTDSLNYYEVSFRFEDVRIDNNGWVTLELPLDQMTAAKIDSTLAQDIVLPGGELIRKGTVTDNGTGDTYDLVIRGRPDLRRVRRYYAGVRYPASRDGTGLPSGPLLTGSVLLNEIRLSRVNKEIGVAKQLSLTLNVPGLGDLSGSFSETDAEFRGLNREMGSGFDDRNLQLRLTSNLNNLIPTFGLDVPFGASSSERKSLPKYFPDGDIVITDFPALQESLTTIERSKSFNFQIRKRGASRNKLIAFTLDRLSYSYSITRSTLESPRTDNERYSDKSQYNYDLNFPGGGTITFPLVGYQFRLLPNQVTLSSAWSRDSNNATAKFEDGSEQVTLTETRTARNNGSVAWSPARNMRLNFSVASTRDPNRRRLLTDELGFVVGEEPVEWIGVNWGVENAHNERLSANWTPMLPVVKWFKPDLQFTGSYTENRAIAVRRSRIETLPGPGGEDLELTRYLDDERVRHLSGTSDLTVRGEMDLGGLFKKILGGGKKGPTQRQPTATQRRQQQRVDRRRSSTIPSPQPEEEPPSAPPDSTAGGGEPEGQGDQGGGETGTGPGGKGGSRTSPEQDPNAQWPTPGADEQDPNAQWPPPQVEPPEEEPEGEEQGEEPAGEEERFAPGEAVGSIFRPVLTMLREFQPIRASWNLRRNSSYQHAADRANWGYRLAFLDDPGVSGAGSTFDQFGDPIDDDFSSTRLQRDNRLNLSTQTRLSQDIRVDLSMARDWSSTEGSLQSRSEDTSLEWPVVSVSIQNVHKWRIFGNAFTSSTFDLTYRASESATGKTELNPRGNPRTSQSIQPRWNFRLQSDLSGNVNLNRTQDITTSAGKENVSQRFGLNMQFTKSFDAQGFLGFLRFGKRGTGSTIDMTLDLAYDQRKSFRKVADGREDQITGDRTYSVRPRFSYQFSRSLTAGFDLSYSRRQDLGNTQNGQTSFGLGFNATFTF